MPIFPTQWLGRCMQAEHLHTQGRGQGGGAKSQGSEGAAGGDTDCM